ncbi:hypothetical protein V1527DRAFT_464569 [Lipomyces starkeyi]
MSVYRLVSLRRVHGLHHLGVLVYNFGIGHYTSGQPCSTVRQFHSTRFAMASTPSTPPDPAQDESQLQDGHLPDVPTSHFAALDLRVGTITAASPNAKARKPAYKLAIDFGPVIGTKKSSAQITHYYKPDELVGRQIIAAVNLGNRRIAGVNSQALVLGADGNGDGVITLLSIERAVPNGTRIS